MAAPGMHVIALLWLSQRRHRAVVACGTQAPSYISPGADEAAVLGAIKTRPSWPQLATAEAVKQLQQLTVHAKPGCHGACQAGLCAAGDAGTGVVCVSRRCLTDCCWDGTCWDWQGCRSAHNAAHGLAGAWAPPHPPAQQS